MRPKTVGEAEAELAQAISKLEKECFGRGPLEVRAYMVHDLILVRLRGVMTPEEHHLAELADGPSLVKEARRRLFSNSRPRLERIIQETVGCKLINLYADMCAVADERLMVITVDTDLASVYQ